MAKVNSWSTFRSAITIFTTSPPIFIELPNGSTATVSRAGTMVSTGASQKKTSAHARASGLP